MLEHPTFPRIGAGIPQSALSYLRRQIKTVKNARGTAYVVVDTYCLTGDLRGHYESPEASIVELEGNDRLPLVQDDPVNQTVTAGVMPG
jgi:hypothetical protein